MSAFREYGWPDSFAEAILSFAVMTPRQDDFERDSLLEHIIDEHIDAMRALSFELDGGDSEGQGERSLLLSALVHKIYVGPEGIDDIVPVRVNHPEDQGVLEFSRLVRKLSYQLQCKRHPGMHSWERRDSNSFENADDH